MATQIIQKKPIVIGSPNPLTQEQLHPSVVVAAPISAEPLMLTKYQFRKLFTLAERTAIDNIQYNSAFSGSIKATVTTLQKDLEVSGEVDLHLVDTISGVKFLESIGLIKAGRAARIIANLPPL
jgi:hypothetical protein